MASDDKVNILLVDDLPAKLLSYETILGELGENLIKAASAREALEHLLKQDIALILVDVCMPDLDGFQLAAMIREHPRFQRTAIIFISAIHLTDLDRLRAYAMGAVDYVQVPVIPEVLRAKVRIFSELYRKTRQLEQLNHELERRVAERTAELEASTARLMQSEERRSIALAAGQMGSWEWDPVAGHFTWDDGQYRIFGVDPESFDLTVDNIRALIHPEDWKHMQNAIKPAAHDTPSFQSEFRVCRPNGELRWCIGTAVASVDATDNIVRISGVTVDITDRKEAEERQALLAREVDHRARNALALVQSIVRLTRADTIKSYTAAVDGRIGALSRAHTLLAQSRWQGADLARLVDEELAPYRAGDVERVTSVRPRRIARAAHRADARARAARAFHQRRQVRRAVRHVGPRERELGIAPGQSGPALDGERRAVNAAAGISGLRHQGDQCQHRAPARGRGRVPLARRGPAMQPVRAARRQHRAAGAGPPRRCPAVGRR